MPQGLDNLSDAELDALVVKKAGAMKAPPRLEDLSDAELDQLVMQKAASMPPAPEPLNLTTQTLRSAAEGASFGLSEPIASGLAATPAAVRAFIDSEDTPKGIEAAGLAFQKAYDENVGQRRQFKQQYPTADIAAQVGGALVPTPISVAGAVGKLGRGAATVLKGEGLAARAGRAAIEGGTVAGASELAREKVLGETGFLTPEELEAGSASEAVGLGAAISGAIPVVGAVGRAAMKVPAKALASGFGVNESAIKQYVLDPQRVKGAKSLEAIKDEIDGAVGKLRADVEAAKLSRDEAKEALKILEVQVTDRFGDRTLPARQLLKEAQAEVDQAFRTQVQELKGVRAPTRITEDVLDSVAQLKQQAVEKSQDATQLLTGRKERIATRPIVESINRSIENLKIDGAEIGESAKSAISRLESFKDDLGKLPEFVTLDNSKRLIQRLDKDVDYITQAGGFTDDASRALIEVRRAVDGTIKEIVPEYGVAMKAVADDFDLLSRVNQKFGTREKAISKLSKIDSQALSAEREMLLDLGGRTGKDFSAPITEYVAAKEALRTPEALREKLPELAQLRATQKLVGQADVRAQQELARASGEYEKISTELAPFLNLTNQNSEAKVKSLLRGSDIETRKVFENLSKLSGQDFMSMVDDLRAANAFRGEFRIGSRNVNLFGSLTGATSLLLSGDISQGAFMAGAGAMLGAAVDRYGPAMTQRILDQYVKIKGMPTVQKIQALSLPPEIKKELVQNLSASAGVYAGSSVAVPLEEREILRKEIETSKLSPVSKARMVNELNRSGSVTGLNELMGVTSFKGKPNIEALVKKKIEAEQSKRKVVTPLGVRRENEAR